MQNLCISPRKAQQQHPTNVETNSATHQYFCSHHVTDITCNTSQVAMNFHDHNGSTFDNFKLNAGDDASQVRMT